jgi:hypothetical protein
MTTALVVLLFVIWIMLSAIILTAVCMYSARLTQNNFSVNSKLTFPNSQSSDV